MRPYGDSRQGVGVSCASHCAFDRKLPLYPVLGKELYSLQTQGEVESRAMKIINVIIVIIYIK